MKTGSSEMHFKVETVALLTEITDNGLRENMGVLKHPINIFKNLLAQVAQRCTEINDPVLDRLMFDLHLYELPSPTTKEYGKILKKLYAREKEYRKNQTKF